VQRGIITGSPAGARVATARGWLHSSLAIISEERPEQWQRARRLWGIRGENRTGRCGRRGRRGNTRGGARAGPSRTRMPGAFRRARARLLKTSRTAPGATQTPLSSHPCRPAPARLKRSTSRFLTVAERSAAGWHNTSATSWSTLSSKNPRVDKYAETPEICDRFLQHSRRVRAIVWEFMCWTVHNPRAIRCKCNPHPICQHSKNTTLDKFAETGEICGRSLQRPTRVRAII